ncbi:MAG: M20/M25/M40 family metallo-hydrolase, partial [Bacteroidota bacterium]
MKILGRVFLGLFLILLLIAGIILVNTFRFQSKQRDIQPIVAVQVSNQALTHLQQAISFPTVTYQIGQALDSTAFSGFGNFLDQSYPLADSLLELTILNDYARLYKWEGKDPSKKPIVLIAHYDVVPVLDENLKDWRYPAFSGQIAEDTLWGRGAIDDKFSVIGLLEAAESLLAEGFQPNQTIYLAFGHDEEIGGGFGAESLVAFLKEKGVEAEYVLDEGYAVTRNLVPGISDQEVALIGLAEKGYCTLALSIQQAGGHSSMPAPATAIQSLAAALTALKEQPFPARISPPIEGFIEMLGPEMPFINRMAFANPFFFENMVLNIYQKSATGNALVSTTMVPTIFNAGKKDNVVPRYARAVINFRMLPGDTLQVLLDHVRAVVDNEQLTIEQL